MAKYDIIGTQAYSKTKTLAKYVKYFLLYENVWWCFHSRAFVGYKTGYVVHKNRETYVNIALLRSLEGTAEHRDVMLPYTV